MGASILLVLVTFCTQVNGAASHKQQSIQCMKEIVGCYNASSQQYPDDRMQECLLKYQ